MTLPVNTPALPGDADPIFRVEIRLRNDRLIRAREELGWTQAEAARKIGINGSLLNALETLRKSPWGAEGWRPTAETIATFYGLGLDYLWPDAIDRVTRTRFEASIAAGVVGSLVGEHSQRLLSAVAGEDAETAEVLRDAVTGLDERDLRVLTRRYRDDWTLEEVAIEDDTTRERIRQIEARGLRRLRRRIDNRAGDVAALRAALGLTGEDG